MLSLSFFGSFPELSGKRNFFPSMTSLCHTICYHTKDCDTKPDFLSLPFFFLQITSLGKNGISSDRRSCDSSGITGGKKMNYTI